MEYLNDVFNIIGYLLGQRTVTLTLPVYELSDLDRSKKVFLTCNFFQGSYASGKCQGNLKFFKVRELSGNFIICQGKLNFC